MPLKYLDLEEAMNDKDDESDQIMQKDEKGCIMEVYSSP